MNHLWDDKSMPHPDRFTRHWWLEAMREAIWVVLISLLIWVYADMEFTDEVSFSVKLDITTGQSQNVTLLEKTQPDIQFVARGSQSALARLRRALLEKGKVLPCDVAGELDPVDQTIDTMRLLELVAKNDEIDLAGLSIISVDPPRIQIPLDEQMTLKSVAVELIAPDTNFEPPASLPMVDLSIPKSRWTIIQKRLAGRTPRLFTLPTDLGALQPGQPVSIEAQIDPILEGQIVTPSKTKVQFSVQVISPLETQTIAVTIQLLTPAAWAEKNDKTWEQYLFVLDRSSELTQKLVVTGQKKNLLPKNITAYLSLSDDDKAGLESWETRDIIVQFKSGLDLKLKEPAKPIKFRLEKRKASSVITPIAPI